jgi:glycine dehydrogenase subunit 1
MRYLPKSPADRALMLSEIGVSAIDDLFSTVPAEYRLDRDLNISRQLGESEIIDYFKRAAALNATGYASFLGAGAYRHYRPVIIDSIVQRGEFLTSYTPYQAEITQGTLQAIFEFQTMICELTGMDIANASMYEGSTGAAEAAMMAVRITGRDGVVVARSAHPEYREVMQTYAQHQGHTANEVGYSEDGRVDLAALDAAVSEETACVLVQSPNFFGIVEDIPAIADIAHKNGALLVVSIAEAVSLGIMRPPVEADIVSLEAQSFGVALSYGGPYCGVIAAKEKYVRQMPGRLVGETRDTKGRRGFVLTLSTREQHIRREKATSNICTNQALVALMATIFLTVYGKGRDSRAGDAEPGQGQLCGRDAGRCSRGRAAIPTHSPVSRICAPDRRACRSRCRAVARTKDHWRPAAGEMVSRTRERVALVRDGIDDSRADRQRGGGIGGCSGCGWFARLNGYM